jgi:NAD(P)H-dependent flavin oxidoreductase YrpB (nitropropane dioxygenase family)
VHDSVHPEVIQGGMGVGVSGWRLARAVAAAGGLGVVSGTALDVQLARRLQLGDLAGDLRRSLARFPYREVVDRVMKRYFVPGGIAPGAHFVEVARHTLKPGRDLLGLNVLAGFVEVDLAREGHGGAVGMNLLQKIVLPTLPTLYGAMLAGVGYVLMGAGIPLEIPAALAALATSRRHFGCTQTADVRIGARPAETPQPLACPSFPISSVSRQILLKRAPSVDGFVVEAPAAVGTAPRARSTAPAAYGRAIDSQASRARRPSGWPAPSRRRSRRGRHPVGTARLQPRVGLSRSCAAPSSRRSRRAVKMIRAPPDRFPVQGRAHGTLSTR